MRSLQLLDDLLQRCSGLTSKTRSYMTSCSSKVLILGMGNPLLDISNTVADSFFKKYDIRPDNAILAEEKHLPMYDELSNMNGTEYIAGGSTLNTIRVAQWMCSSSGVTGYLGSIGKDDKYGKLLTECAKKDGVNCNFYLSDKHTTGLCAVTINKDKERSLTTNLLAANDFNESHMNNLSVKEMLSSCNIVYSAGFFITCSFESMLIAAKHCLEYNKHFCVNFSAEFICTVFKDKLLKLFEYTSIVFTNEGESIAFAKSNNITYNNMNELCNKISLMKCNRKNGRIVIITQGKKPVLVSNNGKCKEFNVKLLAKEKIVDLNGAGDAFVGGYLSKLVYNKSIEECVAAGNYAAQIIIQTSGTKLSGKPNFEFKN